MEKVKEAMERIGGLIQCEEVQEDYDLIEKVISEHEELLKNILSSELNMGVSRRKNLSGDATARKWVWIKIKHKDYSRLSEKTKENLLNLSLEKNGIKT